MKNLKQINWYQETYHTLQKVFWGQIIAILVLFMFAQFTLPRAEGQPLALNDAESLQMLLSIAGLGLCFIAMVLNQGLLKPKRVKIACQQNREQQHLMLSFVLTWSLAFSCALCGFGLAWQLNQASHFSLFAVIAVLTILAHPFTEGRVKRALSFK